MSTGAYGTGDYGAGPYGGYAGVATGDLTCTYSITGVVHADLSPVYQIVAGTVGQAYNDLTATYKIFARQLADLIAIYNVGDILTLTSLAVQVEDVRLPTDLDSFANRLYNLINPVLEGEVR